MSKINLIGLDLETGGLNGYETLPNGERIHGALHYPILEVGMLICDEKLNIMHELSVGIFDESMLDRMDPWALEQHTKSGLIDQLRNDSGNHDIVVYNNEQAERYIIGCLDVMTIFKYDRKAKTGGILFGNSIGFDVSFISAQMPKLAEYFNYRTIDVSSIDLLKRTAWGNGAMPYIAKEYGHTALADIKETHKELMSYTDYLNDLWRA